MKEILKSLAEGKISIEECDTLLKAESIRQLDDEDYLKKGMNHWKRIWIIFLKRELSLITIRELKF